MSGRLFRAIFALTLSLSVAAGGVVLLVLWLHTDGGIGAEVIIDLIAMLLFLTVVCCGLSLLAAHCFSSGLVSELDHLGREDAADHITDKELLPIAERLEKQRKLSDKDSSEIRRRQREWDALTAHMNEGLIIINKNADILTINQSAIRIVGENRRTAPRSALALFQTEPTRKAILTGLGGQVAYEKLYAEDQCYYMTVSPIHHGDRRCDGAVIMIMDITEREQREALRQSFTSNVSHELKTPLTSISGFAEVIMSGMTDAADTTKFASNIYREAQRLISLVGDIIRLSKLDGGEIPYDAEQPDLGAVTKEVIARLTPVSESAGITLSYSGTSLPIPGNSLILDEMISNLVDNAIKYNREGGSVTVTLKQWEGKAVLTVSDTGIGIPTSEQGHIFERFYRVDKSRSRAIGGTGLGLSIVKHGALYHGAEISLSSAPGEGTEISLIFELSKG